MNRQTHLIYLSIHLLLLLASCSKESQQKSPDLYIAGFVSTGSNIKACYWLQNTAAGVALINELDDPGIACDAFIDGNDVYVAGSANDETNTNSIPLYWKNGVRFNLSTGDQPGGTTNSIAVANGHIFVGGQLFGDTTIEGVLWTDGIPTVFTNTRSISGICISGADVYACGTEYDNDGANAVYWKNGKRQALSQGTAEGIFVSGSDVYVCGSTNNGGVYWKNGKMIYLGGATANDIFVSDNDVHVCGIFNFKNSQGTFSGQGAIYWKNGVATPLTKQYFGFDRVEANSIVVNLNDVFVAGSIVSTSASNRVAVIWKNDKMTILGDSTNTISDAYGLFLK